MGQGRADCRTGADLGKAGMELRLGRHGTLTRRRVCAKAATKPAKDQNQAWRWRQIYAVESVKRDRRWQK
jgi:hypothetical protein